VTVSVRWINKHQEDNNIVDKTEKLEEKKPYVAPKIESEEVLEQAALSCDHSAFYNPWISIKQHSSSCGYADS
jgi:hypothetical protein